MNQSTGDGRERDLERENERLRQQLRELQSTHVEEWVRLVRFGSVVPLSVERSLSWRLTRPLRLAQTAAAVLRRDGLNTFVAIARGRLARRR